MHNSNGKNNNVENALNLFMEKVKEQDKTFAKKNSRNDEIKKEKNKILLPIKKLLAQMMEYQVFVKNAKSFEPGNGGVEMSPVLLQVFEDDSSPSWSPGNSIFLENPVEMEIAVLNRADRIKFDGVIIIRCSSPHPKADLFKHPFKNADEACLKLAEFLAENVVRIEAPPKQK